MLNDTIKALSDPVRREILEALRKNGTMPAGRLGKLFTLSSATLSHHLSVLKSAGLVDCERKGTYLYYSVNTSVMEDLLAWIAGMMKGDSDS